VTTRKVLALAACLLMMSACGEASEHPPSDPPPIGQTAQDPAASEGAKADVGHETEGAASNPQDGNGARDDGEPAVKPPEEHPVDEPLPEEHPVEDEEPGALAGEGSAI